MSLEFSGIREEAVLGPRCEATCTAEWLLSGVLRITISSVLVAYCRVFIIYTLLDIRYSSYLVVT